MIETIKRSLLLRKIHDSTALTRCGTLERTTLIPTKAAKIPIVLTRTEVMKGSELRDNKN